jgi:hypothetical protein
MMECMCLATKSGISTEDARRIDEFDRQEYQVVRIPV